MYPVTDTPSATAMTIAGMAVAVVAMLLAMPSRLLDRELEPYFSNSELVPKPVILRSGVLRSEL